jgi:hypothetical protein
MSALGFTTPLLLLTLLALPVLWWLLRAVPPAPVRRRFPGVALLLGLRDAEAETDKTPWWLLALRMLALAAVIVGFAGPVLNPRATPEGSGPLLVVMDASWASAGDWPARMDRLGDILVEAGRAGRTVAIQPLTAPLTPPEFLAPRAWPARLAGLRPAPWVADYAKVAEWAGQVPPDTEVIWFSDGLAHDRAQALAALRPARVIQSPRAVLGLRPATFADGTITLEGVRSAPGLSAADYPLRAIGPGPDGIVTQLATGTLAFASGAPTANLALSLPPELRNRVQRFEIGGQRSAGAVSLTDDALQRREVALLTSEADAETQSLLSPLFYLNRALAPTADLLTGALSDMLLANPDVLIMADVAGLSRAESDAVEAWVANGGLLVRFAGPRLAASDLSRGFEDPLMPVRLRDGGRTVGGALSWGAPKTLRAFEDGSPFFGLKIPADVTISSQVMAQPDPDLAGRAIAALTDGTPLVTRKVLGEGQVVLFHVTANAEWSTLPLSGLFVQMLERLAVSTRPAGPDAADLADVTWVPALVLDGYGTPQDAGTMAGVAGAKLAAGVTGPDLPPGLYAGAERRVALNVISADTLLTAAVWPSGAAIEGMGTLPELPLLPVFLTVALFLLALDVVASLALGGRLRGAAPLLALLLLAPPPAQAQDDALALLATSEFRLGYVTTGDARLDDISRAGLTGLSRVLTQRTSVEPAEPLAVNIETDELSVFPLLYWPVTPTQQLPTDAAYAALNRYLRSGGMIVFDTRDADVARFGGNSPNGRMLQALAAPLDIPPLEPVPADHVLTRTFYLLQDFPGRYISRDVWVEAAPQAQAVDGMPFRTLNDGVTPVLVGGNDWAAAWAVNDAGQTLLPVGRGYAGERQREIAYRFGVNLVMHVLSGNYKSDQVHVPALLDRLGQ